MRPLLSAPTVINLEITDVCNESCRHCYNFWREENSKKTHLDKDKFDQLIEIFKKAGIFHVVLTGGEPMARFDMLEYGFRKLTDAGISISCNSNLALATEDRVKRLRDAGLDHILTSLCSYDAETNDYMTNTKGIHARIVRGIETTVKNGIRVSVNMVVSQRNKDHVYQTAKFVHGLGCQKIFGTRTVPSVNLTSANGTEFELDKADAMSILDQLVRAKEETGIMVGTLVSYPLCLLGDLEKYQDFVGRGCPAQSGHIMSLNANGDTHACPHEEINYGNIFKDGISDTFMKMRPWHDNSYANKECEGCDVLDICQSGCRMSARAYGGELNKSDQLMVGKNAVVKPYKLVYDPAIFTKIDNGQKFTAPKRLRFRKENGFYLVNIRWANSVSCPTDVAEFLIKKQASGEEFTLNDLGKQHRDLLAKLFFKDVVESKGLVYADLRSQAGLSADIMAVHQ